MHKWKDLFELLKISHWIKNLYLFAPLFFSGNILQIEKLKITSLGFLAFSLSASFIYIFNDLIDYSSDIRHPIKSKRPIASGSISFKAAIACMLFLVAISIFLFILLPKKFFLLVLTYTVINIMYTLWLKNIAILDISIISIGFVLRVLAGGAICSIYVSHWLIIMIFLLSMFLALAKRRDDVLLVESYNIDASIRKSLSGYNLAFLNASLISAATIMIVCYIMYITSAEVKQRLNTEFAYFNIVFVVIGVLKYFQIIFVNNKAGSPTKVLLTDIFIQLCVILWLLSFVIFIYWN